MESKLIQWINNFSPKSILQVGCSDGYLIGKIIGNVPSLDKITGCESDESFIDHVNPMLKFFGSDKYQLVKSEPNHLPFSRKTFDLSFTYNYLTHIQPYDMEACIHEIYSVTKYWIIHVERFAFPYDHPSSDIWSHCIPEYYKLMPKRWELIRCEEIDKEHATKLYVFRNTELLLAQSK